MDTGVKAELLIKHFLIRIRNNTQAACGENGLAISGPVYSVHTHGSSEKVCTISLPTPLPKGTYLQATYYPSQKVYTFSVYLLPFLEGRYLFSPSATLDWHYKPRTSDETVIKRIFLNLYIPC